MEFSVDNSITEPIVTSVVELPLLVLEISSCWLQIQNFIQFKKISFEVHIIFRSIH